jgi:hypothetical protein
MNLKKQFLPRESLVSQLLLCPEGTLQEQELLTYYFNTYSGIAVGMCDSYMPNMTTPNSCCFN